MSFRLQMYRQLLDCESMHRVADRLNQYEPRKGKRSLIKVEWMTKPRAQLKRLICNGLRKSKRHSVVEFPERKHVLK